MLHHERLHVYQRSCQFARLAIPLSSRLPRGWSDLADQFRRAMVSIALNIAEGCGRLPGPDRMRFYAIARGSALECAAILDIIAMIRSPAPAEIAEGKAMLHEIVSMLSRMCTGTGCLS